MNRFRSFAAGLTACLMLSGCGSVYLHDEGLKTSTSKAHEALAGATPLKPFDDQLANLAEFAKREDLAVANFWAGVRDKHFNAYLSSGSRAGDVFLREYIAARLKKLAGSTDSASLQYLTSIPTQLTGAAEGKANYEEQADFWRRSYLKRWAELEEPKREAGRAARMAARRAARRGESEGEEPKGEEGAKKPDLGCKAVVAGAPADADAKLRFRMSQLKANCVYVAEQELIIATNRARLQAASGEIGVSAKEAVVADEETKVALSEGGQAIEAAIKAASKAQKQGAEADLLKLRADIRELLGYVDDGQDAAQKVPGAATLVAGWDKADETVDALLRAEICDAPEGAVDQATKDAAKCPDIEAPTTAGRSQAVWATLKALAQLQDANDEARRSANWLLAAKAIIAAERADAALRLQEAKARAAASSQRLDALLVEAVGLIKADKWRTASPGAKSKFDGFGDCEYDISVSSAGSPHCAFAFYVEAWNRGRLPAEMLRYRTVQIDREYGVRRSRSVAEKQYALASAGAATLKEYGEGGIMPETVAQTILDLGTIGALRLED